MNTSTRLSAPYCNTRFCKSQNKGNMTLDADNWVLNFCMLLLKALLLSLRLKIVSLWINSGIEGESCSFNRSSRHLHYRFKIILPIFRRSSQRFKQLFPLTFSIFSCVSLTLIPSATKNWIAEGCFSAMQCERGLAIVKWILLWLCLPNTKCLRVPWMESLNTPF